MSSNELQRSSLSEKIFAAGVQELGQDNKLLLYPVSQKRRLPDAFLPDNAPIALESTENGHKIATLIAKPLARLLQEARRNGNTAYIASAFRSVNDQESVFNGWVKGEVKGGLSEEEAIAAANAYSARPGFSEHHLGTVVDVLELHDPESSEEWSTVWDKARENYSSGLYLWLRKNAYIHGFVISYPTGSSSIEDAKTTSGYPSAEPWHLRFVGKIIAQALIDRDYLNPKTTITLNSFLESVYL